jgi:ectoine hydroxylase-related dioxygenase (phytanoyl-CoA dioxygenase family)
MVPPETLNQLNESYGYKIIEAKPGDVLFFHTGLVHGSSHNIGHQSRMVILSQLNTKKNVAKNVQNNARQFNLKRSKMELKEAERRLMWYKNKYESQLNSEDVEFNSPIPEEEREGY